MNRDRVVELQEQFAAAALPRGFREETIASAAPDPVSLWTRSSPLPQATTFFLSSGIHGDERCGPAALAQLFELQDFPPQFNWIAAPLLNPSGFRLGCRETAEGIDLNRDFLRREALETRSLMDWWLRQPAPCDVHLSLHEDWEATGFYLYEINTSLRCSLSVGILRRVGSEAPLQETGPVDDHHLTAPGLIVHPPEPDDCEGWPEAIWMTRTWPVESYTFEAPGRFPPHLRIHSLALACQAAITAALQRLTSPCPPKRSEDASHPCP